MRFLIYIFFIVQLPVYSQTYIVDNPGDIDDSSAYVFGDGTNTLRKCVRLCNLDPGPNKITFDISDTTIFLTVELQVVDSSTTIDGEDNNITIRPASSFPSTDRSVVWIRRPRSVLKNLALDCRFAFNIDTLRWGVWFEQAGADYTPRSKVENCEIGYAQGAGVVFESTQDTVINCWIHDYGIIGILPMGGTDNYVLDCKIGTNKSGNAIQSLPGSFAAYGIDVTFENNVLAGTDTFVVLLAGNNAFIGNKVGVGQNGITTLGISGNGVIVTASGNTIGDGTIAGANVISGNGGSGIVLDSAFDNTITMNCIGTDKGGTRSIPNGNHGIEIRNQSSRNAIKQNKIANNLVDGINISGPQVDSNTFVQNLIFDNGNSGINIAGGAQVNVNPPTITKVTEFKVLGTASQNAYVQVFADDAFQGGYFVGDVTADALGNWSMPYDPYAFPYELEYVLATQDSANSTSAFGNRLFVDANSFNPPEITSYNGISPNGDGVNDVFYIENIRFHDDNRVQIYNRWGDKVADIENYDNVVNVWRGENQFLGNEPLPDGTYFYVVLLETEERLSGYVELKR